MLMCKPRRIVQIALAAMLLAFAFGASTAHACGCGIYIPREGEAKVAQERSLVRWDGQREDIVMSLGVLGGSKEAAVILPIPSRADVKLANDKLFDELDELTKPLVQEQRELAFNLSLGASAMPPEGAVGAGAPPVTVLSRQNVGPFDVANLEATDASALKNWLDENGFQLEPRIADILQPYIDQGWTFVAVRLQPDQAAAELGGDLTPLWIAFDSQELVYPMRASANADNSQSLNLYILADHRIDKQNAFGASRVSYANWIEPAALVAGSALEPFIARKFFLTKFVDTVNPHQVTDDFKFAAASQDMPYREVTIKVVKQDATGLVLLGCLALMFLGVIAFVIAGVIAIRHRSRPSPAT
jgi:hypothetical protein